MPQPTVTIVIITYLRPEYLRSTLTHVTDQTVPPLQTLVVDGSPDTRSRDVCLVFPAVTYVKNSAGAGNMTSSRNAAVRYASGDIIAFLDDDAFPRDDYVAELLQFLQRRPEASIGCCRAVNNVPGEEAGDQAHVGRLTDLGDIQGNFAVDTVHELKIDHGLGATMWIAKPLLERLEGFREYFGGTAACEDTDLFLRARRLGYQAWFVPRAVAEHVAAPQEGGERFDIRYTYWSAHNAALMFLADRGARSQVFWRMFPALISRHLSYGAHRHRRIARASVVAFGWLRGTLAGLRLIGVGPSEPIGAYYRPASDTNSPKVRKLVTVVQFLSRRRQ